MRKQRLVQVIVLGVSAAVCSSAEPPPPSASKCGNLDYAVNVTTERTTDWSVKGNVVVGNGACNFYAEVVLENPARTRTSSNASAPNQDYSAGSATVNVSLPMNYDDGQWHVTGKWRVQDESVMPWRYYPSPGDLAQKPVDSTIRGFVQFTGAQWTPASIQRGSTATFTASLIASNNCTGLVGVIGTLTSVPPNMGWNWHGVYNPIATYTNTESISAGQTLVNSLFPFTALGNGYGTVRAEAQLASLPTGCDARTPLGGSSANGANLTVAQ